MKLSSSGKNFKNRRLRLIKLTMFVFAAGALFLLWQNYSRSPAEGTIVQSISTTQVPNQNPADSASKHFNGSVISFDYPGYYADIHSNSPENNMIEQLSTSARFGAADSRYISVTIKPGSSDMKEDSAYTFRLSKSLEYSSEYTVIANRPSEKIIKADGSEIAYFIQGDNYYAIIVATTTRAQGGIDTDLLIVTNSLSWIK